MIFRDLAKSAEAWQGVMSDATDLKTYRTAVSLLKQNGGSPVYSAYDKAVALETSRCL